MAKTYDAPVMVCTPKSLPKRHVVEAARVATSINPHNHPRVLGLVGAGPGIGLDAARIGALTTKYWRTAGGVRLTVGFLDNPERALRKKILAHMNAWAKTANVKFVESGTSPQVRIARAGGAQGGYWSYLGTDILLIDRNEQTMNLEAFTLNTPESEFVRVVRHETGHTLGFPHEHMRKAMVDKIDRQKAIQYFGDTQGWSEEEVVAQVLTPIEDSALWNPTKPDGRSIMCYQIPGTITKSGKPILGGLDIDKLDYAYAGRLYPKSAKSSMDLPKVRTLGRGLVAMR